MSLEMEALANALEQWGQPVVSGIAQQGLLDVVVTGRMVGYTLVIDEPVAYMTDVLVCS